MKVLRVQDKYIPSYALCWFVLKAQEKTFNDAVLAKENLKTSAINKLKGATYSALTDAEAKALFGE